MTTELDRIAYTAIPVVAAIAIFKRRDLLT